MGKHTRKLTRAASHSFTVNIPKGIVKKYGWKEKQKLTVVDRGRGKVEIRDWKRR